MSQQQRKPKVNKNQKLPMSRKIKQIDVIQNKRLNQQDLRLVRLEKKKKNNKCELSQALIKFLKPIFDADARSRDIPGPMPDPNTSQVTVYKNVLKGTIAAGSGDTAALMVAPYNAIFNNNSTTDYPVITSSSANTLADAFPAAYNSTGCTGENMSGDSIARLSIGTTNKVRPTATVITIYNKSEDDVLSGEGVMGNSDTGVTLLSGSFSAFYFSKNTLWFKSANRKTWKFVYIPDHTNATDAGFISTAGSAVHNVGVLISAKELSKFAFEVVQYYEQTGTAVKTRTSNGVTDPIGYSSLIELISRSGNNWGNFDNSKSLLSALRAVPCRDMTRVV
jgi:hypothetical protein